MARPPSAKSRSRPRRPSRRPAASRKNRWSALPGWAWLVLGVAVAIFVVVVLRLAQPRHDLQSPLMPSATRPHDNAGPVAVPPAQAPRYSFYQTLPKRNLAPQLPSPRPTPSTRATPAPTPQAPPATTSDKTTPPAGDGWLVQVGSYRSRTEADRARARVDLMGVVAHTEAASIDGQTWYRVRIGPVDNQRHAEALRERLKANGVTSMLVKQKG